jgi:hypothetical protein
MFSSVDTKDPHAVGLEVQSRYQAMFLDCDSSFVPDTFAWAVECFTGKYQNYQAIDALYHDFEHTLQGTLCMVRLLHGRHKAGVHPRLDRRMFELGLMAILLHDTGYLKTRDDTTGTGAKYTLVHVGRSADFAAVILQAKGCTAPEIQAVQHMIRCTGVNVDLKTIPFSSDWDRAIGYALGTADLLGQMAAPDYIEKLPILYKEFEESAASNSGKGSGTGMFASAEDLMRKTPLFWEKYVRPKIEGDFQGMYRFLNEPPPDGPNGYLQCIQANLKRLQDHLARLSPVDSDQ